MAQAVAGGRSQHLRRESRFGRVGFFVEYKLEVRDSDVDGTSQKLLLAYVNDQETG